MKHILIDFENIQPTSLDSIADPENTQIWLFLGVHQQKTLPYPLTKSLFHFASQHVHFVEMQRTGKNALDHYLAFYLGKISEIDHHAQVCILAKDGGYDILVEHLNATHIGLQIQRLSDLKILNGLSTVTPPLLADTPAENAYALLMSQAYQQIVAEIKTRLESKNFIPTKKDNFLSALQKKFLAELLKDWQNDEQFLFAQKLFSRLINYGLIKLKDDGTTLIYQFSEEQLRENVAKYVVLSKPKTVEKLKNVLKSHMNLLQMPTDETTIAQMLQWLKNKNYIYETNYKISYEPPLEIEKENPIVTKISNNQELTIKAVNLLKGKFANNRPIKESALVTIFVSQLKLTHRQASQVIDDLEKSKKITIPSQGKIIYHL